MNKNKTNIFTVINRRQKAEAYSELWQTSEIVCFTTKVNKF